MATWIPELSQVKKRMSTSGERRFADRLDQFLEDDYFIWFDIPVGRDRRYPDFIILHPRRGVLFLEVKDWKFENLQGAITKEQVSLIVNGKLTKKANPLEQSRQCSFTAIRRLQSDPLLKQTEGKWKGNLIIPYAYGAVLTNISSGQMTKGVSEEEREGVLPDNLIIYKDQMLESADPEVFQERMWGMFKHSFDVLLTQAQIDRIRFHLFPEVRIDHTKVNGSFDFDDTGNESTPSFDDVVKVLDVHQERLAKGLGEGHRVIHGVAGSGKTLILGYRCRYLYQIVKKPILVLCFNVTLAARLRSYMKAQDLGDNVHVYHFHEWCAQQIKTYNVKVIEGNEPFYERQVKTVISGVEKGNIPRAQYDALLIDEAHDFESDWLKLITQMVNPETDSLLLLYDDAQSIYKDKGLGFTLSSVGVKAKGRTTILKLNYRNTKEILEFGYKFAKEYIHPEDADDDHIPVIEPDSGGGSGQKPAFRELKSLKDEVYFTVGCVKKWQADGISLSDIAILVPFKYVGDQMSAALEKNEVEHLWMKDKLSKTSFDPSLDRITVTSIQSSKGLEFKRVIIVGIGLLGKNDESVYSDAKLLYVGITRAQENLVVTSSTKNEFSKLLAAA